MRFLQLAFSGIILIAGVMGCGPDPLLVSQYKARPYMQTSPHRQIVILPFDCVAADKDQTKQMSEMMGQKLALAGFSVIDRAKTLAAYRTTPFNGQAFGVLSGVSELGQSLGAQAVLVGSVNEHYREHESLQSPDPNYKLTPTIYTHIRLIDCATKRIIWSGQQDWTNDDPAKWTDNADAVTNILSQQLIKAALQQKL